MNEKASQQPLELIKKRLRKRGITYASLAKRTNVKEWKVKFFFSGRKTDNFSKLKILNNVEKIFEQERKKKSRISNKMEKICTSKF